MSAQKEVITMELSELYREYKQSVYRLALTWLRSVSEAEDVTQETFLRLVEWGHRVQPGKEKAWLLKVTANLCRDRLRARKRQAEEPLSEQLPGMNPAHSEVLEAVLQLPVKERTVVYLYYFEGYSTMEIAAIRGCSRSAVSKWLAQARVHLKSRLEAFE